MDDKNSFKLIDGTFTPFEASQILFALIDRKISYHRMEKFSNTERFGKDISQSEKRIDELMKVYKTLKQAIDYASEKKLNLKIDGVIEITFAEQQKDFVDLNSKARY